MAPSTRTADALIAAGARSDRVAVVAEGGDHLPPANLSGAAAVLRRAGVDPEVGYILSSSTLEPRKNLQRMMEAYREARPSFPAPWPLVVQGPKGWGEVDQIERPDGVVLLGAVDDPATRAGLYRLCRALIYVPLVEGFGLPPVEAMREGAPVVASDVPSVGDAALLVDATNIDAIARAMVTAATDDEARRQLIDAGTARAAELTWKAAASRHVELWKSIA